MNLILKLNMILFLQKNSTDAFNIKKNTSTTSWKIWSFHSYTNRLSCRYRKTKKALITDGFMFTENLIFISTKSLLFEKHCKDIFSNTLIRGNQDSYLYYFQYKNCESSFADVHFSVVFNSIENFNQGIFSKTIDPTDIC